MMIHIFYYNIQIIIQYNMYNNNGLLDQKSIIVITSTPILPFFIYDSLISSPDYVN